MTHHTHSYSTNDNLAQTLRLLCEQWFYRFDFPNAQNLPYNRANRELEWNDNYTEQSEIVKELNTIL